MDELTSLGLILLLALLAGHLVRYVRVPEVTGYILAGVALGPSVLGWVSHENLAALQVLSEVALGLILFSIGSVFEFSLFRRIGPKILYLALVESTLAAVLVSAGMLAVGQSWQVAGRSRSRRRRPQRSWSSARSIAVVRLPIRCSVSSL